MTAAAFNSNMGRQVFAPCSCGFHSYEQIARRFPLLIRALKWAACLSDSEAVYAIRDYRHGWPSGEAVSNFARSYTERAPRVVILEAIRSRSAARTIAKLYPQPKGANR